MKRIFYCFLALLPMMLSLNGAQAGVFFLIFNGDSPGTTPGPIYGLIFGLFHNGNNQKPTGALIIASPMGINNTYLPYLRGTFDVENGKIIGASQDVYFYRWESGRGTADLEFNQPVHGGRYYMNRVMNHLTGASSINTTGLTGVTFGEADLLCIPY